MAIYFGLTIDEKLALADAYYAEDNHIRHFDWSDWTDNEKKASLNQAEREINLYLGIDLEASYSTTEFPVDSCPNYRPDLAVFEQAFYVLDNTARKNTSKDGVVVIESAEYQKEEKQTGVTVSPQAERFLKINRIRFERG